MYGQPDFYGNKYTGFRPAAEVAALIRADLKAAQKAGELPTDVTFSVRARSYAGGQAVDLTIIGRTNAFIYVEYTDAYDVHRREYSDQARELMGKVEGIHQAYNRNRSDSMVDYFDVMYYGTVNYQDDHGRVFAEREKARLAALKAHRAGRKTA